MRKRSKHPYRAVQLSRLDWSGVADLLKGQHVVAVWT